MKIKVMILDDEFIILDGLISFPWEEYGCEVVVTAGNGIDGIRKLEENEVDLIITDIRMPGMDGLEFSGKAKELYPDVSIIILTGYDYFEYAQNAISIGVEEFLLKPIDYDQMKAIVEKVTNRIREKYEEKQLVYDLKQHFYHAQPQLRARFTANWIQGRIQNNEELRSQMTLLDLHIEKYQICVGRRIDHNGRLVDCDDWLEEFAYENIAEEIFANYQIEVQSDYNTATREYVFVLSYPAEMSDTDCSDAAMNACEKIQLFAREYSGKCINFGLSEICTDLYYASQAYRNAQWTCHQCIYLGTDVRLLYQDIADKERHELILTEGEKSRIMLLLFRGDPEEAAVELRAIFSDDRYVLSSLKFAAMDLILSCMKFPENCAVTISSENKLWNSDILQDHIRQIGKCTDADEIVQCLLKGFMLLVQRNTESSDERNKQFAKIIRKYIEENYMQDLSMELLADHFHVSKTYISRILKNYTGQSFLEYLTDVRFEQIDLLMKDSKYRQHEIAEMVGYHDFGYYIKVFKKRYGVTPAQYRRNL